MKKLIIFLILCLPLFFHNLVFANTTDTPIASSSQEITSEVVEKIKTVVQDGSTSTTPLLVGLVGTVNSISDSVITFTNKGDGNRIQASTDSQTAIVAGSKPKTLKDISVDSKLIIIGTNLNNDIIKAKRIIILPESAEPTTSRSIVIATITGVNTKAKTITLLRLDQTEMEVSITKNSSPAINSYQVDQKIIAIIKTDNKSATISLLKAKTL